MAEPTIDKAPPAAEPEPAPVPTGARLEALRPRVLDAGGRGHVESYFLKANHPDGSAAVWLKFTVLAGLAEGPVAEVWAIVFDKRSAAHRAAKETYPLDQAKLGAQPFRFRVGKSRLEDGWTRGHLQSRDGHEIGWDLTFQGDAPPLFLLPSPRLYEGRFPRSKLLTPYPDLQVHGAVRVDEREWAVEGWPGSLGHNWGREHAHRYAWGHVNAFDGAEGSWFEGVSAKVKVGPFTLPFLSTLYVHHAGEAYDFRAMRHWLSRVKVELFRWSFEARSEKAILKGELAAEPRDLVGLRYLDPTGKAGDCLNTKIGRARIDLTHPDGRPIATLRSDKAALEILERRPGHGVRIHC